VSIAIQARDLASRVVRGVAAGLKRSFDGVSKSVKAMVSGFRNLTDFGAKLGTVFATWGSWLVGLGGKIRDVVAETSDFGGRIADLAAKTGLSTDALQEFAFAASQTGVAQETFLKSTEVMSRKFGEMAAGSKTLYTYLATVGGRALADQAKRAKNMGERLELMLVAMSKITDEERRLAFSTQVFGEEGRDMALVVADGTDRLRELREEAHRYHAVMDGDAIKDTARFGDEMDKLDKSWTGVKRIFGVEVIRALLPEIERLTRWLRENPESVRRLARELGEGVATAVRGIRDGVAWIWDHRGDILTWAKTLAVVFGAGGLLGSIGGIIGGLPAIGGLRSGRAHRASRRPARGLESRPGRPRWRRRLHDGQSHRTAHPEGADAGTEGRGPAQAHDGREFPERRPVGILVTRTHPRRRPARRVAQRARAHLRGGNRRSALWPPARGRSRDLRGAQPAAVRAIRRLLRAHGLQPHLRRARDHPQGGARDQGVDPAGHHGRGRRTPAAG